MNRWTARRPAPGQWLDTNCHSHPHIHPLSPTPYPTTYINHQLATTLTPNRHILPNLLTILTRPNSAITFNPCQEASFRTQWFDTNCHLNLHIYHFPPNICPPTPFAQQFATGPMPIRHLPKNLWTFLTQSDSATNPQHARRQALQGLLDTNCHLHSRISQLLPTPYPVIHINKQPATDLPPNRRILTTWQRFRPKSATTFILRQEVRSNSDTST